MKTVTMIGAQKRIVPGGFTKRVKRRSATYARIKEAAIQCLNRRIVRGTDVHP